MVDELRQFALDVFTVNTRRGRVFRLGRFHHIPCNVLPEQVPADEKQEGTTRVRAMCCRWNRCAESGPRGKIRHSAHRSADCRPVFTMPSRSVMKPTLS